MKRKLNLVLQIILLMASATRSVFADTYSGGIGEPNDPYRIATAEDLNDIGNHVEDFNKCFVMVADINLASYTGNQFNIIGDDSNAFAGVFDGNSHTISNFTHTDSIDDYVGLFGITSSSSEIKIVGLINPIVYGAGYVGGLVGYNNGIIVNSYLNSPETYSRIFGTNYVGGLVGWNNGTISNSHYSLGTGQKVTGINYRAGGLVGFNTGTINNSYALVNVYVYYYAGGLVGYNEGIISNSYAISNVSGGDGVTGGLVGCNNEGTISNSYSISTVSGNIDIGGLVGGNFGNILNSYTISNVIGESYIGGLVGYNHVSGTCTNSFWNTDLFPTSSCGEGKTTAEMQTLSTFVSAGWDFGTPIWVYYTNGYPRLAWEPT